MYLLYVSIIFGISATHVVHEVAQKLTITTLPRKLCGVIFSPLMPRKVTSGALLWVFSDQYAAPPSAASANTTAAGLIQDGVAEGVACIGIPG